MCRYFTLSVAVLICIAATAVAQSVVSAADWRRVDREIAWPEPNLIHQGPPLVRPRGIMMNATADALWVGDPGSAAQPSRIVRFPIVGGNPGVPDIFFSDPSILIQAKWALPATLGGIDVVVVPDQGEEDRNGMFTGVGAKVIAIPINPDGSAGTPVVLWAGPPFICPTGIARIGDYVLITDPCAGPLIHRPEMPFVEFPSSILFALKVDGSQPPVQLYQGSPFTSMIGVCRSVPETVLVNDTDAGRLDPTGTGGRPGFAPPAAAEKFIFDLLDPSADPPTLGIPRRQQIYEEGPLTIQFLDLPPASTIKVCTVNDDYIVNRAAGDPPRKGRVYTSGDLDADGNLTLNIAATTMLSNITLQLQVDTRTPEMIVIPKPNNQPPMLLNNKHAGSKRYLLASGGFVDNRFTVDQDGASVWIYPEEGDTPVRIAHGGLIIEPLSGQLDAPGQKIWIVDKAAASLYQVDFPSPETFDQLFPWRGQFDADTDTDSDGTPDCLDGCPDDPNKSSPGACGCGVPDTDTDGDGVPDCNDFGPCEIFHDGSTEDAIGFTSGGHLAWMHRQGTPGGFTVVSSISTAYGTAAFPGSGPANGSVSQIAIWDDPNDDGDPTDGVLLQLINTTVANTDTDILNVTTLNPPVGVSGFYFIGAGLAHAAGIFPAPWSNNQGPSAGRAWIVGDQPGPLDYNNLAANSFPPDDVDTIGLPGVWLLQVNCQPFLIQGGVCDGSAGCPCSNNGSPGNGCANQSFPGGANMAASGGALTGADSLVLNVTDQHPSALTIFWQGSTAIPPTTAGDGLRCFNGGLKRLFLVMNSFQSAVSAPSNNSIPPTPATVTGQSAAKGDPLSPGATRGYFAYFRSPNVAFCPPATFNSTNAVLVVWGQ